MKSLITRHPFVASLAALIAVGSAGSGLAWAATHGAPPPAEQAPPAADVVAWSSTPAADAIRGALAAVPAGWTRRGEQSESVTPPFPLTCDPASVHPVYSASQQYNNGVTVVLASYSAGAGAVAMSQLGDHADGCTTGGTTVGKFPMAGLGVESFGVRAVRGAAASETAVFRRGDLIGFVLADGSGAAQPAKAVDDALAAHMGACTDPSSTVADAARSPWTGVQFTGMLKEQKATIADWHVPSVPPGETYKPTPIPAPVQQVAEVKRPDVPDFPVWPALPDEQKAPKLPDAPAAAATTQTTVMVRAEDTSGPGCGWAFTGTAAPAFDAQAVAAQNDATVQKAQSDLQARASAWSDSVLAYWKALDAYQKAADSYTKYADAVAKVDAAWEPIRAAWADYRSKKAAYDAAVSARDDFNKRKAAAQASYDTAVQACAAPTPSPSATASPSPSATASPSPSASAASSSASPSTAPTASPTADRPGCPAAKPDILSQDAPSVPDAPTQPQDPTPKAGQ